MDRHREIIHVMWSLSLNCLASKVLPNLTLLTQTAWNVERGDTDTDLGSNPSFDLL